MINIENLTTETNNEKTKNIDHLDTIEVVELINQEDAKIAAAVGAEKETIAHAIDAIAKRFKKGGRIIYIGAGSSGRIGVMDAAELTPTYGVPATRAFGIMAGGEKAMFRAVEGAEDSEILAIQDLSNVNIKEEDTIIGIAASGRTPYTIGAIEYGNKIGALTIAVTCNKDSEMAEVAQISIAPIVGPEAIMGSTRMKAGTAQKLVVNMLSTGVMIKIGKIYQNYMVHMQPTNEKLVMRAKGMISNITGATKEEASKILTEAENNVAVAIVMYETKINKEAAQTALAQAHDNVREAIAFVKHS